MGKLLKVLIGLFILFAVIGLMAPPEEHTRRANSGRIETGAIVPRPSDLRREALQQVTLDQFSWSKGGFGSVMLLDKVVIKNSSKYPAKDFLITCALSAPSGTSLDVVAKRLYEAVPAGKQRAFGQVNMGFMHSQAARASCQIADASIDLSAPANRPK